jgi:hypothetical protein
MQKSTTLVSSLLASVIVASTSDLPIVNKDDFTEAWFTNKIDHYNFQSNATYQQRYWYNDVYCPLDQRDTCPIFLYICGEYRCSVPDFRFYPFMIGAAHNAQLLVLEHRYYGDS